MSKGTLAKKSSSVMLHSGSHKRTGVKYASMNSVYGPNTDLSFMENFIESTKIYSTEASHASPLTHDCFIRKKGFILLSEVYKVSREMLDFRADISFLSPLLRATAAVPQTELFMCATNGDSRRVTFYTTLDVWKGISRGLITTRTLSQMAQGESYTGENVMYS